MTHAGTFLLLVLMCDHSACSFLFFKSQDMLDQHVPWEIRRRQSVQQKRSHRPRKLTELNMGGTEQDYPPGVVPDIGEEIRHDGCVRPWENEERTSEVER